MCATKLHGAKSDVFHDKMEFIRARSGLFSFASSGAHRIFVRGGGMTSEGAPPFQKGPNLTYTQNLKTQRISVTLFPRGPILGKKINKKNKNKTDSKERGSLMTKTGLRPAFGPAGTQ